MQTDDGDGVMANDAGPVHGPGHGLGAEARAVMVPTYFHGNLLGARKLEEYYKPVLDRDFRLARESGFWRLYVKRDGALVGGQRRELE